MNNKREKVFYIVMTIFFFLAPFALFFDVFEKRWHQKKFDGTVERVIDRYNITNIKELSNFPFIVSILFMVFSLIFAVFLIIDLYKKKYYRIHIKILSGITLVLFAGLMLQFSITLGLIFFIMVCLNLFMLSFDIKLNRKYKANLLIYIPTYILFLAMIVLSIGFNTTG